MDRMEKASNKGLEADGMEKSCNTGNSLEADEMGRIWNRDSRNERNEESMELGLWKWMT